MLNAKVFHLVQKSAETATTAENKKFSLTDNLYEKVIEFLVSEARPGISQLPTQSQACGDKMRPVADQCQEKINQL